MIRTVGNRQQDGDSPTTTLFGLGAARFYLDAALTDSLGSRIELGLTGLLLCAEAMLGILIIQKVPYTEIDWKAYMQEVEYVVDQGELDYRQIRGDTGPLVYPAGFVYLFAVLRALTNQGVDLQLAQYLFLSFYTVTQGVVFLVYQQVMQATRRQYHSIQLKDDKNAVNESFAAAHRIWMLRFGICLLCLSKRLHSIFLLRLFNDGPTMLLAYVSIWLFQKNHWDWGCLAFSLAVSIKMNVLLMAPGLLLLLLQQGPTFWRTVVWRRLLLGCALPQLVLGAPFLLTYPVSYLRKAFELDRVFFYKWTVNWKFLSEDVFLSRPWALLLLLCHLLGLGLLLAGKWPYHARRQVASGQQSGGLFLILPESSSTTSAVLAPDYVAYTMLVSNFVGIAFARTLHYQFYCWYMHSIPLLLFYGYNNNDNKNNKDGRFPWMQMFLCVFSMGALEWAFLTYPATPTSSLLLQVAHGVILISIVASPLGPVVLEEGGRRGPASLSFVSTEGKKTE